MTWLVLAFGAPLLWAASTHIDKYLVEKYFRHSRVGVLLLFTAIIGIVPMIVIPVFVSGVFGLSATAIAVMAASGVLYLGAMYFYLGALQHEEASIVAPLFQAAPIFTYGLSYFFLHEILTGRQLMGAALMVAGALAASFEPRGEKRAGKHGGGLKARLVLLMLACALSLAASSVIFKFFAVRDDFWPTTFWMFAGELAFGVLLFALPGYRREFLALFRRHPGPVIAVNGSNEAINLAGGLAARYAALLGPLALVQAVSSTTPVFVFLIGVLLSLLLPRLGREDLSRTSLVRKGAAIALMVPGTVLILPR